MEALELTSNKETKTLKQMSGAQAVVHSLIAEGVDLIFGYPGGAIMPVYDALYDYENELNHVLVRHEQGEPCRSGICQGFGSGCLHGHFVLELQI